LPLALLGASALFLLHYTTVVLKEVVEEAIEEMHPIMRLPTLTLMAAMPPNDYLIHGEPAEKGEVRAPDPGAGPGIREDAGRPL
jgi:hypothetical protein